MKIPSALLLSTAPAILAGTVEPSVTPAPAEPWIKPVIDIRSRYEFADIDGLDPSHAFTFRERLGLKTCEWNGFSALLEGEFSQAVVDDYHGGAAGADPFDPANSLIADPETNELNQGYLQYSGFDSVIKAGRQRIVYDNAAFIGDVIWRQNQQTFDAFSLQNKSVDGLVFNYAFINQVNRIFGSDADAPLVAGTPPNVEDLASEIHLINASYSGIEGLTLGAYAYLMEFDEVSSWDNQTFGASVKGQALGLALYGELAWQDDAGLLNDQEALYAHVTATKTFGSQSITLGVEHLDDGFKTPLATVHAFNGFSDVTDGARLSGAHNGLTDVYLSHTTPLVWGIKWTNVIHAFGDNSVSADYGWEYDSVLVKKFDDHFTAIAKLAVFDSEGEAYAAGLPLPDATRCSIELNYTF